MWWTNLWAVLLVLVIATIMLYLLIDRICRCVETCKVAKAYGTMVEKNNMMVNFKDFCERFNGSKKEK